MFDEYERKRDSGLAPTTTSSKQESDSVRTVDEGSASALGIGLPISFNSTVSPATPPATMASSQGEVATGGQKEEPGLSATKLSKVDSKESRGRFSRPSSRSNSTPETPNKQEEFAPLTTPIPTDSLLDEGFLDGLSFSKRGSIMFGGKKAVNGQARAVAGRR